jgi:hypothetical protein
VIDIFLDERSVFTYNAEDKGIGIFRHRYGFLKGPVEGPLGFINFPSKWHVDHMIEMLQLLSEKMEEEGC